MKWKVVALLCSLALVLSACQPRAEEKVDLLALPGPASKLKVDGLAVPQSIVEAYARQRGWDLRDPGQNEQVHSQLGEVIAVALEAQRRGLLDDPAVQAELAFERINKLSGLFVARELAATPITEEVLRAQYDEQLQVAGSEELLVSHVLFDTPDAARTAAAELAAGQTFDAIIASRRGQSGVRDARDLGWVRLQQLPPALAAVLQQMPAGAFTAEPVATEFGHHVAWLRERRPFQAPTFESLRENIRSSIERQRALDVAKGVKERAVIEH